MGNMTKTLILIAILSASTSGLAATCAPEDHDCLLNESQLQAIKQSGLKPSETPESTPSNNKKNSVKPTFNQQPFMVPPASDSQTKETVDSPNQTQDNPQQPFQFDKQATEEPPKIPFLPAKTTVISQPQLQQPQPQQPIGIQYH